MAVLREGAVAGTCGHLDNALPAQSNPPSLKHEDVYLRGYTGGIEARAGIGEWIVFYNNRRLRRVGHMPTGGAETAADRIFSSLKKTHPADGLPT